MSSRLFQEIREKRGLAYSVYSFISSYVDTGMFGVYAAVKPDRAIEAIELVLNEIKILKKQFVTTTELNNAKEYTKGNIMLAAESNEHQMFRLAQNENLFGRYIPLQDIVDQIDRITKEDIVDLADQLFQTDRMSLTLLGPVQQQQAYKDLLTVLK
jgi:predicted Zn-dependent peptidase